MTIIWKATFVFLSMHIITDELPLADVVFVVDSSSSIGKENWELVKTFLKHFVEELLKLEIGPNGVQVSL